jgi:hypothetical protein
MFWWHNAGACGIVARLVVGVLFDLCIAADRPDAQRRWGIAVLGTMLIYRPGPMQAEPVNLVRRGTEQP